MVYYEPSTGAVGREPVAEEAQRRR
jgi:hypothetical protein